MEKKLPMATPYITTYPAYANIYSMIGSYKDSMNWFYHNFVDLKIEDDTVFFAEYPTLFGSCPWLTVEKIAREQISLGWPDFIRFVVDCIDQGCYLNLTLDQSRIPEALRDKQPFYHETLIYGYDLSQERIYLADNFEGGNYKTISCSFAHALLAYVHSNPDSYLGINKISVSRVDYRFDLEFVRQCMTAYINCRLKGQPGRPDIYTFHNDKISRFSAAGTLDIRDFHLLWSHKKCMLDRLNYMRAGGYIQFEEETVAGYRSIIKRSYIQLNLALKYLISKDKQIITRIIEENNSIRLAELTILEELFAS